MPLIAIDIDEARLAFDNMEARAQSAEIRAGVLQAAVDKLNVQLPMSARLSTLLSQQTVDQAGANSQLRSQQATQVSPDIPLANFIASIGMSAALGEASMPDRTIPSIKTTVTAYHTADGGLRFYQPEFGDATGVGSTTFFIAKTPAPAGAPTVRNFYVVVEYLQTVFDDPFWTKFVAPGPPPVQPASQIVFEAARILSNAGGWSFPFLVQEAGVIASEQTSLASLLTGGVAPTPQQAAFVSAVQTLSNLVKALDPSVKPVAVVGDLLSLTAALDTAGRIADTLRS